MAASRNLAMDYAWAIAALRQIGANDIAERFARREHPNFDRTAACIAILSAVDAVGCRRAARADRRYSQRWLAIADDQAEISAAALSLCGVREVAR